jgi:hypothetical protein
VSNQITQTAPRGTEQKPGAPVEKLAFNLRELCASLGVSRVTVYRLEQRGLLKAIPGIRHKLYAKREVERFLTGKAAS